MQNIKMCGPEITSRTYLFYIYIYIYFLFNKSKGLPPPAESESLELEPGNLHFKHASLLTVINQSEFHSCLY